MAVPKKRELYDQFRFYLEFIHRLLPRWWQICLVTVAGAVVGVALSLFLPHIYESRALLTWQEGVSQRRVFAPSESSAADWNSLQGRLAFLVSSDTRLRDLLHTLDLYPGERASLPERKVMERMREAIRYDSLGGTSFWLSFEYPDRYRAQAVVSRLVHDFIEENAGNALGSAVSTRDFMEGESKLAGAQVEAIDDQMARFVSEHPEFQTDPTTGLLRGRRVTEARGAQVLRLPRADTPELRHALREKGQLEAQLRLQESGPADPAVEQARKELSGAQQALAIKRQRYTDAHPDVQHARAYLAQVQAQLRAAQSAARSRTAATLRLRQQLAQSDQTITELARPKPAPTLGRGPVAKPGRARPAEAAGSHLSQSAQAEKRWYQLTRDRTIQKAKYDLIQERLGKTRMAR